MNPSVSPNRFSGQSFHKFYAVALLAAIFLLNFTSIGYAGIYSYKDENGAIHFTDDLSKIPKKYRKHGQGFKKHEEKFQAPENVEPPAPFELGGVSSTRQEEYDIPLTFTGGGNFLVEVTFNGSTKANLMVDTGASMVTISEGLAKKLGLNFGTRSPRMPFSTAGGKIWMPVVALDSVQVGNAAVKMVEATVNNKMGEEGGLLGMSFLGDFRMEIDQTNSKMILKDLNKPGDILWDGKPETWWRSKFFYYKDRASKLEQQSAQNEVVNPSMSHIFLRLSKFYQKLQQKLERRASRAGVPQRFR